jgi:hypothetical protein
MTGSGTVWDNRYAGKPEAVPSRSPTARGTEQGLQLVTVDNSVVAQDKARRLAEARGVSIDLVLADLGDRAWRQSGFGVVVAIFIQFAGPALRTTAFDRIHRALKPGGLLLLEGYRPEQLANSSGGPSSVENLCTDALLRSKYSGLEIVEQLSHDLVINEGTGRDGMSALIDQVARKPDRTAEMLR